MESVLGIIFGTWLGSLFANDSGPLFWIAGIFAVLVLLSPLGFFVFAYCIYLPFVTVKEWFTAKTKKKIEDQMIG